jgi:hypothetical protein
MIENEGDLEKALKYRRGLEEAKLQIIDCRSSVNAEFIRVNREIQEYQKEVRIGAEKYEI